MERLAEQQLPVTLNFQTVKTLLEQTEWLLNQTGASESHRKAMENLKKALEEVLPYVPQPLPHQTDELTLEKEIREEIKIAGANENG